MTNERWRQVEEIFNQAVELPEEEREPWLARVCGDDPALLREVRSLLLSDGHAATVDDTVRDSVFSITADMGPRRAGPYELIDVLGRGGMGTVYRGRRADKAYDAQVAVKIVAPGSDTEFILSRFRQERQTLARLNHPSIARLIDGGQTNEGVHYIVMEFVDGPHITEYCVRHDLSVDQILRLMREVCLAVDYAHRHFVVHRDIKPGNILVDSEGTPKLLDFGICKLLGENPPGSTAETAHGRGMLTVDYASPEQVLAEPITARSDVYSLGAVLYELLTGVLPNKFDKLSFLAIEQAIVNNRVTLPSVAAPARARTLRGDLDNIVMRALEVDPNRRYESAAALAEDLRRYLEHEPVLARPAGGWYLARKFVQRHRVLTTATAAAMAALAMGLGVSLYQMKIVEKRDQQLRALARTVLFDIHDSVRTLPGATAARQLIVNTALGYLDALGASRPNDGELLRELAAGYQRIGDVQGGTSQGANTGNSQAALQSYAKSVEYWDRLSAKQPRDQPAQLERLKALRSLGDLQHELDPKASQETYARAEAEARRLSAEAPDKLEALAALARILISDAERLRLAGNLEGARNKTEEALKVAERRIEISKAAPGSVEAKEQVMAVVSAESALGMVLARQGDLTQALKLYQRSAERGEALVREFPQDVNAKRDLMMSYGHIGDVVGYPDLASLGDRAASESAYIQVAAIARELHTADKDDVRAEFDLAVSLMRLGVVRVDLRQKEKEFMESRSLLARGLARSPNAQSLLLYSAVVERLLGETADGLGRPAEALEHWKRSVAICDSRSAADMRSFVGIMLYSRWMIAQHASSAELRAMGLSPFDRGLELAEKYGSTSKGDPVLAKSYVAMAMGAKALYYRTLSDVGQAQEWRSRALAVFHEISGRPDVLLSARNLLQSLETW